MRPETAVVAHNGAHGPARRRLTGRGHSGLPQPGRRFPAGARHPRRRLWSLDGRRRRRPRRHIGPEPDPQHRLVDPPAHVGHPGHAGLLPRGRLCQRALLALGAAKRRGVCRVVAFAPPSPGDAGHPTPSRGDRLDCVCRGRAWRDPAHRLTGGAGAHVVPRRLCHGRRAGAPCPETVGAPRLVGRGRTVGTGWAGRPRIHPVGQRPGRVPELCDRLRSRPHDRVRLARRPAPRHTNSLAAGGDWRALWLRAAASLSRRA